MANRLYSAGLEGFLDGSINMSTGDIRAMLVDGADYTPSTTTDKFLSSVPAAARVATTASLTGKTITAGVFDAADSSFVQAAGDQSELIVLYLHTGSDATARLIELIDTVAGGTALSVIPNGGDISVVWDPGPSRIFAL